ncbi:DUF418 domain-containing protein [Williamsia maris]|uniref:Membrane protein YeiB n=1 Tax=Williamsia maris TaxID=72806 RepID=A0ABT1HCY9_9NOCA|nr:acyltransferase family protein [Williamsia maris]MCP2175533.1 putative membrane protein YeiB [Williamsia maris]
MTTPQVENATSTDNPATSVAAEEPKRNRGIDLARGIAMFGMFAVHVGPPADDGSIVGEVMQAAQGRSSILFATLAGVSLALMTGGSAIRTGRDHRKALRRILIRAALLIALGTGLVAYGTPVAVILAYYGVFFVFTIPFLRMRPRTLLLAAAGMAVIGPMIVLLTRGSMTVSDVLMRIDSLDPIDRLSSEGITKLILTGVYPTITWLPFLLVGVAIARFGINRLRAGLLAAAGVALMVVGYAGAALATLVIPATDTDGLVESWKNLEASAKDQTVDLSMLDPAVLDKFTPGWRGLFGADPHSGTFFEIVGGIGTALLVLGIAVWLSTRFPRLTWPVAAVGAMSLTIYTAHVIAINCLGSDASTPAGWILVAFIGASMVFATCWLRVFDRGPLERVMHQASVVRLRRRPVGKRDESEPPKLL